MKFFDCKSKKIIFVWAMLLSFGSGCFAMSSAGQPDIEAPEETVKVIGVDVCPICLAHIDEPATSDMPPYIDCTCCGCVKNVCLLGVDARVVVVGRINEDPTRCNHQVHYRCLLGWQQEHGTRCPICGAPSFCILQDPSIKCFDRCQKALCWIPATILLGGVLTYVCLFIIHSV